MPTIGQMNKLWEADREFGISARDEHGNHIPSRYNFSKPFTGEEVEGICEVLNFETGMPRLMATKNILELKKENGETICHYFIDQPVDYNFSDVPFSPAMGLPMLGKKWNFRLMKKAPA